MSAHGRAGQGHYKSFPCSNEVREKIAREKNNGNAAGGGAARQLRAPPEAGRANTLTIFFEMRSNFSKNEHHLGNKKDS